MLGEGDTRTLEHLRGGRFADVRALLAHPDIFSLSPGPAPRRAARPVGSPGTARARSWFDFVLRQQIIVLQ
jgi:hypothetical protein